MRVSPALEQARQPADKGREPDFSFLDFNLESCRLFADTKQAVREATPRGSCELVEDGSMLIRTDRGPLGASMSHHDAFRHLAGVSESHVVVVYGLGTGQLPRALRSIRKVPLVVYEPDPAVLRTVLSSGPLDLGETPIVSSKADLTRVWRDFSTRPVDVVLVPTPGYAEAYPTELEALGELVRELLQRTAISKATYQNRGRFWVKDIIENVELLADAPHFLTLQGQFPGVPAFIVGAGPSLDGNVEHLKEAAKKGIVFATNSGAVSLARHGIEPQVVVCIESIDSSSKLSGLPFLSRAVRAFSLAAAPRNLRTGTGPLLPIHEAVPQYAGPLQELTGCPGLAMSSSVSTTATSLARALGCDPIVLVGQDLAYSGGRTYATGTGYEDSAARICEKTSMIHLEWNEEALRVHGEEQGAFRTEEPLRRVEAWGGEGEVDSGLGFAGVQAWFEATAQLMRKAGDDTRLINATEGGVRIAGYEELRLQSLLSELPERTITAREIGERARTSWRRVYPMDVVAWLCANRETARRVRVLARRVRRLATHAAHATKMGLPGAVTRAYQRLELAEGELRASILTCPLVDAWSYREVDEALERTQEVEARVARDAREAAREAVLSGARVARAVERAAVELAEALEQARERVQGTSAAPRGPEPGASSSG